MTDSRTQQFYEAINSGIEGVIRQMLDADPSLAAVETPQGGGTPLHWVSLTGQVGIVELLIARGADVDAEDANGFTSLQLAASRGHADVIRVLLRNGADVLAGREGGCARLPVVETEGNGAVRVLVATMTKHRDMLKCLVKATEPDTPERGLILTTIVPAYSNPEVSVFALAIAEATRAGVLSALSPLIQSVQQRHLTLYDLSITERRSGCPVGKWNEAFLAFNDAINTLLDYVPAVEDALQKERPEDKKPVEVIARFPSPPGLRWEEVTITFVSNDAVEVKARGISKRYTYAELGFKDGRRGDMHDTRWEKLRDLADCLGEISWDPDVGGKAEPRMKAAVKDIRKRLKALMGIDDDPFDSYRKVHGYRTKFTLTRRPVK